MTLSPDNPMHTSLYVIPDLTRNLINIRIAAHINLEWANPTRIFLYRHTALDAVSMVSFITINTGLALLYWYAAA